MATISINDNDARIQHTIGGGGNTANSTEFTIDFPFFSLDDISVIITNSSGVDTIIERGTGVNTFAVNGTAVDDGFSGGNITLGSVYTSSTVTIFRDVPITRISDFATSGPFNISSLNTDLDKIYAVMQQIENKNDRALTMAESDDANEIALPNKTSRKGNVLAFNEITGAAEAGPSIGSVTTVSSQSALINTVAGISANIEAVADISSDVTTVAGIESNVTTVAGQTTNLQNVTDNLSAIQNASTNATNASNSAIAAAASAAAAALSADTFDDTYLGAKASDPIDDNDGDALTEGDLYFNTTSNNLKVYTGSAWADAALTAANFLTVANNLSDLNNAGTARTNLGLGTAATSASTDFVAVTGDAMTGDLTLGDNNKAIFGAGSDLEIYHDGFNSIIHDNGTGLLKIRATDFRLSNAGNTADYISCTDGGDVDLSFAGAVKLSTTSYGIDISGSAVADTHTSLGVGATPTPDMSTYQNFIWTLNANANLGNPSTEKTGQTGFFVFIQDGTGGHALSLASEYKTAGGAGIALSTAPNAVDIVPYIVQTTGTILLGTPQLAFS